MKRNIIIPKDHADWLEHRSHGIGSSEIGTILGLNRYETPYQLWLRKTGQIPPQEENEAMLMGHILEDAVAQRWAVATGNTIIKESAKEWIYYHPEHQYFRASPDRIYWEDGCKHSEANKCILECKTTRLPVDEDNIPQTWFCQVQWLMFCTGYRKASLAWLRLDKYGEFGYKDITFNEEFCNEVLAPAAESFWKENVQGGAEPEIKDVADLLLKYPKQIEGKTVEATGKVFVGAQETTALEACEELVMLKAQIKELETRKTELESGLKMYMNDAEAITITSPTGQVRSIVTWKAPADSLKFDAKRFREDNPKMYEQYQTATQNARKFLVKAI